MGTRIWVWAGASAFALLAAGLSLHAAAIQVLPADSPTAGTLSTRPAKVALDRALDEFIERRGRIHPANRDAAIAAAARLPLDERPYIIAAIRALEAGRDGEATRLLERARRLNPRQRVARLLLIERYLRSGRIAEGTSEIAVVNRLLPGTQTAVAAELARLMRDPSSRTTTRQVLARNPGLLDAVLAHMAREGVDAGEVQRIAGADAPAGTGPGGWRTTVTASLIEGGRYLEARSVWAQGNRVTVPFDFAAPLFDPRFTASAPPPFGWRLVSDETGAAERHPDGLNIEFFGRRSGVLAEQMIVAAPGAYRLSFTIEGSDGGEEGPIAIAVQCAGEGGAELARMVTPRLAGGRSQVAGMDVTVPASCPAQWLRIAGVAREFASPASAIISQLMLIRTGS